MMLYGNDKSFNTSGGEFKEVFHREEEARGYDCQENLWSPGFFRMLINKEEAATFVASTESWDTIHALDPKEAIKFETDRRQRLIAGAHPNAHSAPAADLVLAADQFIVAPLTRTADMVRSHAAGDEIRTVIAGYHWFTDWGRDAMISLEGLALATGRFAEAGFILRTIAHHVRDGLIPNMFPEGEEGGLYNTADATLWFFHAIHRYLNYTRDYVTLYQLLPVLIDIVQRHVQGTAFGIGVDPEDGLLKQGEEGFQLTWMDAKVGNWVVTPRRGKTVEINALWYNALRLMENWLKAAGREKEAESVSARADRVYATFNERFWFEDKQYLYDVIDGENGDDPSFRPNQIFSISLPHPVLHSSRWTPVIKAVKEKLLTPFGLRSLSPDDPEYKSKYYGDLRSRDAAYHQGTVWSWLIGPFIDAWIKVHPEKRREARKYLKGLISHLDQTWVGSVNEVFSGDYPHNPEGCVAQAWSVAEMLRCWIKTGGEGPP